MKLMGVKWVDSPEKLPTQGGVYYIATNKKADEIVYVGQSENLRKRLKARHQAWHKAIVEFRSPYIGYELIPEEKTRKNYEHLRIGQLSPQYNDGGFREPEWQLLSYEYVSNLIETKRIGEETISKVSEWLNLTWEDLDKAKGLVLLARDPQGWPSIYPESWRATKLLVDLEQNKSNPLECGIVGSCRGIDLLFMEHLEICSHYNMMILDVFLGMQNSKLKSWTKDESKQLETSIKALMKIQDYLNPDFIKAWPNFLKYSNLLVSKGIFEHNTDTVIDFLDHCIAWSLVLDVPYLRLLPRERVRWFNQVFLEYVYRNKHQVEDWAQCGISSEAFVVGFHHWCIEENRIPEIQGERDGRMGTARVRIQE